MAKITLNIDALNGNVQNMSKQIEEFENIISRFTALLDRMRDSWEGAASISFQEKLQQQLEKTRKQKIVIENMRDYILDASEKFSALDKQSASSIRNTF